MKIGLGMIVRNEEVDLPKCLETYLSQVDVACILDTGSNDRTMAVAREILRAWGKPFILERYMDASDWEGRMCDFGKARNEYVRRLEEFRFTDDESYVDYILSADADDIYLSPADLKGYMEANPADIYMFKYWIAQSQFFMSYKLWKADSHMRYAGKVHEVLGINWDLKILQSDIEIKHHVEHHESQENGSDRNRRILRPEIYPPLRSLFYWANENVDIGNHREAIKWYIEYIRRAKEGEPCWDAELAHCYWRAARWLQHLGDYASSNLLCNELLKLDPSWSEAWCQLAYNARCNNDFVSMKKFALRALENKFSPRLFSEADKYSTTPATMLLYLDQKEKMEAMAEANK
jgi:glycosyltransferase involved in cell wall biosynthesis